MALNRQKNDNIQERVSMTFAIAAATASATTKLWKVPTGRKFRVERVLYLNPTGLAADNTNNFRGTVNNASVIVAAIFNTDGNDVPAGAALAANTFVEGTLSSTASERVLAAAEELSFVATEEGDSTLPAGTVCIEGYLI